MIYFLKLFMKYVVTKYEVVCFTKQIHGRITPSPTNCRQPSKFQRGEPCDECAAGGPSPKPVSEWIFLNNIMFYDDKIKILA